ncbi:caspase family protein [Bacillus bombysepticus]
MNKRALIVGINYPNSIKPLKGCINDAKAFTKILVEKFDFSLSNMQILIDDTATRKNILDGLKYLIQTLEPGDIGAFVYSGHGTQTADLPPIDEEDMKDEAIVPYDSLHAPENYIRDDEIHELLNNLKQNVQFTIIFDSCHAETADKPDDINSTETDTVKTINQTPGVVQIDNIVNDLKVIPSNSKDHPLSGTNHYLLAGCKASQKSRDNEKNGYFTNELIKYMEPGITYEELQTKVVPAVMARSQNEQEPQFTGPNLTNKIFIL